MTTLYTSYDPVTGVITGDGEVSDETLEGNVNTLQCMLLDVRLSADTHYVVDHAPVAYTPEEVAARAGLVPGWVWKMPERLAVDQRTLDAARVGKIEAMSAACGAAIVAGFKSSALGAQHTYPAKLTDQNNLAGSVIDSLYPGLPADWCTPFWCANQAGEWAFRMHTAAQIQQVGREGKAAILACMTLNETLRAQIMAAQIPEIDSINWPA